MIKDYFWKDLTRTMDQEGLHKILKDEKATNTVHDLDLQIVPKEISPGYVKSINKAPGILTLALDQGKGVPFVVPGGRFNEMYGWDSYFESIGLLIDGRVDLAMAMADNFAYQIRYYGKILNANRSYYLTRTQPPFFSSLLKEIYEHHHKVSKLWLSENLKMVIKEYQTVWMQKNVRLTDNGLSRFYGEGIGIPPETEEGHFETVLKKYAAKHDLTLEAFITKYDQEELKDKELDRYFTHDRSMRESGHDTSNRLDDVCADLNTVALNSLLYKYEMDIAFLIKEVYQNHFEYEGRVFTSEEWLSRAEQRKQLMNNLMWNENDGVYYDYNFKTKEQQKIASATNYYPIWAGLATKNQASRMVKRLFDVLVQKGGISGTSDLLDKMNMDAPQRQWDYPNGWAPHQMLIWRGLERYNFVIEVNELAYRWLWMITKNAVEYNGTIPEKYDVVACTHKVYAEYGNVGTEFDYITSSGFGWMNASYQYGLTFLNTALRLQLDELIDPDKIFKKIHLI